MQLSKETQIYLERLKNGEVYDCSFNVFPEELDRYLTHLKDLQYELNYSLPSQSARRAEIIKELFEANLPQEMLSNYSKEQIDSFEDEIQAIMPYYESFKPVYSVFLMITEELNIF